jgi:hypothetical protein
MHARPPTLDPGPVIVIVIMPCDLDSKFPKGKGSKQHVTLESRVIRIQLLTRHESVTMAIYERPVLDENKTDSIDCWL